MIFTYFIVNFIKSIRKFKPFRYVFVHPANNGNNIMVYVFYIC